MDPGIELMSSFFSCFSDQARTYVLGSAYSILADESNYGWNPLVWPFKWNHVVSTFYVLTKISLLYHFEHFWGQTIFVAYAGIPKRRRV